MGLKKEKQPKFKPPKLLSGLPSLIFIITGAILVCSWAIINYQVEKLVAQRTSEYARSITQIAANSAAEALMSDDKIQLQQLVVNVAKDPYIRSATVFADDGQIVAEKQTEPALRELTIAANTQTDVNDENNLKEPENTNSQVGSAVTPTSSTLQNSKETQSPSSNSDSDGSQPASSLPESTSPISTEQKTEAYLASQQDIPFVEKIVYQGVTAGWFKITLNRAQLESSFRDSLGRSQQVIATIALLLFIVLIFVVHKYRKRVNQLVKANHRLIKLNSEQLPRNTAQWLESVNEISETQFQALTEHPQVVAMQNDWHTSRRDSQIVFCYCQFAMADQENELTASTLSTAENYLQLALQAYGLQSQGDVLSGCLIPLFGYEDKLESLNEAISLLYLIKKLLSELTLPVKMRAFVGSGNVLVLENERGIVNGVSLSNRMMDKLGKLAPHAEYDQLYSLALEESDLGHFIQTTPIDDSEFPLQSPAFRLTNVKESIIQRINRQVSYIISQLQSASENNSSE